MASRHTLLLASFTLLAALALAAGQAAAGIDPGPVCPEVCEDEADCPTGQVCYPPSQQCQPPCDVVCIVADPVCGDDGNTYPCGEPDANCHGAEVVSPGPCPEDDCICPHVWAPVCGVDGNTYPNACEAQCAPVEIAYEGTCGNTPCAGNEDCEAGQICFPGDQQCRAPCNVQCFRADFVCGTDGNTYPCGEIDAWCHGVDVAFEGPCDEPCLCPKVWAPVCGSDGQTYPNACQAACADVEVAFEGECPPVPECAGNEDCPQGQICYPPDQSCRVPCDVACFQADYVCGADGNTYGCGEVDAWCHGTTVDKPGPCDGCEGDFECPIGQVCAEDTCEPCLCPKVFAPVCGADGQSYGNSCEARCAHVEVAHEGECGECQDDGDCEVGELCLDLRCDTCDCPQIYDPVCGVDGETYGNQCFARCAHVPVAHEGQCTDPCVDDAGCPVAEVCLEGSCTPCTCPRFYAPVCGVDGQTYGNACEARCGHVETAYEGECPPPICEEDTDRDLVPDAIDNCTDVPNGPGEAPNDQVDTDGDGIGNVCDCDFDQSGTCNVEDFGTFVADLLSGADSGRGTDMNADGTVNIEDFSTWLPGFLSGAPGPPPLQLQ